MRRALAIVELISPKRALSARWSTAAMYAMLETQLAVDSSLREREQARAEQSR